MIARDTIVSLYYTIFNKKIPSRCYFLFPIIILVMILLGKLLVSRSNAILFFIFEFIGETAGVCKQIRYLTRHGRSFFKFTETEASL